MGLNRVILTGRLTGDPELRYTPSGRARVRFSIAVNQRYRDQDGQIQETTTYVPIVVWGAQAESCANYLEKGRLVAVDGRLRIDTFETSDGERRKVVEVVAQRVEFLGGRREEGVISEEGFQAIETEELEEPLEPQPPSPPPSAGSGLDEEIPF